MAFVHLSVFVLLLFQISQKLNSQKKKYPVLHYLFTNKFSVLVYANDFFFVGEKLNKNLCGRVDGRRYRLDKG